MNTRQLQLWTAVLEWAGKIAGTACIALLVAFMFGENGHGPRGRDLLLLTFFPGGVLLGFAVAWWRLGLGAVIALASTILFYSLYAVLRGGNPGPWFAVLASPALVMLATAILQRRFRRQISLHCSGR